MSIQSDLEQSMNEESSASISYRRRAENAGRSGDFVTQRLWEHIAEEEDGHYNEFKDRLTAMQERYEVPSELIGGVGYVGQRVRHGMYERPSPRLFPQTDADWWNLAEDIKEKDRPSWDAVNGALLTMRDGSGSAVDDAKRWLVEKAGELNIS